MAGNKVQVLESFRFQRRRPRKDLGSQHGKRAVRPQPKRTYEDHFAERKAYVDTIRELAKNMTIDQAMAAIEKSESAIRRAAHEGGFLNSSALTGSGSRTSKLRSCFETGASCQGRFERFPNFVAHQMLDQ